jgi:adenine-specific DNA-methyltransferase
MTNDMGIEKIDLDKVDWRGSREFFESLGEALDKLDDKDESYDFTWVGKRKSIIEAGAPINKTLRPDVEASKNWDATENLFIEGDNLDALKLLQESYLGKVKMIYIDPPYNTGKDFVYHDNFKASTEQYDEDTEYKDEDGNIQFKKNEKTNGRYHSDWLSMMYPRLKLARNLLSDDGAIFISIGQDEIDNTIKLVKETFGEDNYISTITRVTKKTSDAGNHFAPSTDYIVAAAKSIDSLSEFKVALSDTQISSFNLEDEKGKYKTVGFYQASLSLERSRNARYYVDAPDGTKVIPPEGKRWRTVRETYDNFVAEDKIVFKQTKTSPLLDENGNQSKWNVYTKSYVNDRIDTGSTPRDFIDDIQNNSGNRDLKSLELEKYFDFPKPTKLITYLAGLLPMSSNDIILDFFSGSATTAHAVMQLNAEDGGNRKWIMVQLPEETDEKSEAFKAGYKTIPEISRERIRRAGDKIATENPEAKVDYGFRSLVIAETNYKEVYKPAGELQQSALLDVVDNIKEDRSELDLLFGVLTASALELNRPLETRDISGATVYLYDYFAEVSGFIACFAESISEDAIKQIAALKPLTAVFRDSTFPDSQAKVNLAEHFRIISPETKVKVI